jgi:hypothetical protein
MRGIALRLLLVKRFENGQVNQAEPGGLGVSHTTTN